MAWNIHIDMEGDGVEIIDEFEPVMAQITLLKELHDIGRHDIANSFSDELSYDSYYENMLNLIELTFSRYYGTFDEDEDMEISIFGDDVISNYFDYAWQYGKLHRVPYNQNPLLTKAENAARRFFDASHCVGWKLLGYTKTKKMARQSKLIVLQYTGCGCNALEHITFGLVRMYSWFADKCAEFEALLETETDITSSTTMGREQTPMNSISHIRQEVLDWAC